VGGGARRLVSTMYNKEVDGPAARHRGAVGDLAHQHGSSRLRESRHTPVDSLDLRSVTDAAQ